MSSEFQSPVSDDVAPSRRRRYSRPSFEMSNVTITIPVLLLQKIDHCIEHDGMVSRSAVIRMALARYFNGGSEVSSNADTVPVSVLPEASPE